jgi:hypothetical protein
MDSSVWALIIAFGIDVIIFTVEFYIFSLYRKVRNKPVYLELSSKEIKLPVFSESDTPLIDLLRNVWNVPYEEISYYCGLEGKLYLALQMTLCKIVLLMAILGCSVLVPVYSIGTTTVDKEMNYFSMAHIIESNDLMAVVLIYFFLFSLFPLISIFLYLQEVSTAYAMPSELSCNINKYALEIRGLPHDIPPSEVALEVRDLFVEQFPEEILSVYSPPNYAHAFALHLSLQEAKKELLHYNEHLKSKKERPKYRESFFSKKVDAIEHFQELVEKLNKELIIEIEKKKNECSGFAFVLCRTPAGTFKVLKEFQRTTDYLNCRQWMINKAPAPGEVNWENMTEHKKNIWLVRVALFLAFFIFFFLLVTPAGIFQVLVEIFEVIGFGDISKGVLSQFLPSIILLLYQSAIVRHTVLAIVKKEELSNKSEETVSCLFKYLLVMITYTFIVPLVGLQVYALITDTFVGGFEETKSGLTNQAAFSGLFFTIFIMQMAFLKCGSDLLQIPKYVRVFFRQQRAVNERERLMAYEAYEFRWAYEYGVTINAFVIIMAFSVAYPLILPFGVLFYTMRYFTAKYNLLCFYCTVKTTTGHKVPRMIVSGMLVALLIFQLFTCALIFLSDSIIYFGLAVFLLILSCILFLVLYCYRDKVEPQIHTTRAFGGIEEEEGIIVSEDISSYYCPLDLSGNSSRAMVSQPGEQSFQS